MATEGTEDVVDHDAWLFDQARDALSVIASLHDGALAQMKHILASRPNVALTPTRPARQPRSPGRHARLTPIATGAVTALPH
ncbi:hypothetical protein [Amycolatopsis alkalitolerans]|uniref:Uncharacterized protein n=1 Tax=Amycolatopsis alkalitolerans TaxID=2547244 RepID=A0A5C4LUB9_9PSEU|nr:hypothetical protein [Amycolatopsis alkalitolerans]TNC21147.1 hypothetical protein FG385_28795 [Amycolatopsis alkalitolerans]